MAKIYVGSKRIKLTVPTSIDLTDAVLTKLYIKKPNGAESQWTATISGTNLIYYTVAGDLDIAGLYYGMAYVTTANGIYWGETFSFKVWERYK